MGKTNDINSMTKLYIFRSQKAGGRGASAVDGSPGIKHLASRGVAERKKRVLNYLKDI
jgi:hypothetical protein